jgi:hypothetical protein
MPRNEAKPLSRAGAMRAYKLRDNLVRAQSEGTEVAMRYVKRDGHQSASVGYVDSFLGVDGMDTMSVNLVTADKGIRTINLSRVIRAWPVKVVTMNKPISEQGDESRDQN